MGQIIALFFTGLTSVPIWDKVFGISFSTHNHHPSSGALFEVDLIGISSEFPLGFAFFLFILRIQGGVGPILGALRGRGRTLSTGYNRFL